ncbi:hypothetical protein [Yoonia sp.]|uniref:hypothetical protein n=1 Tax=Yoonia sp. TaxID=2212373 RepID=UPI003F6B1C96
MGKLHWLLAALATGAGTGATAQDAGLGLTNFGAAVQGEIYMQPNLNARAVLMGGYDDTKTFTQENYTIDGTLALGGLAALADYYPLAGSWRVSGGVFFSNSELAGNFTSATSADFTGKLVLKNDVAPIVTTGFKNNLTDNISIYSDFGVVISSLEASSDSVDPTVQADIAALNNDLSDLPVVPFVGVGVTFGF